METKYKIAFLTFRMIKGFGVDVVVNAQATGLTELGHEVTVYAIQHDETFYANTNYRMVVTPHAPPFTQLLHELINFNYDFVIAHTSPFFEILPGLTPYTTTVAYEHGDPTPALFPNKKERKTRIKVKENKYNYVYPYVNEVLAITDFISRDINFPVAKVVYNGADHLFNEYNSVVTEDKKSFNEKYNLSPDKTTIMSVARLGEGEVNYKGVDQFCELRGKFTVNDPFQFVLVGKGTEQEKTELEQKNIRVILNASNDELVSAYKNSDIFVTMSKWEGFNLPLAEAQSFGRPALALDRVCHSEVTPLVFPNIEAMADKIKSLSAQEVSTLGEKCRQFVSRFTWENNVKTLNQMLDEIKEQPDVPIAEKYDPRKLINEAGFGRSNLKYKTVSYLKRYKFIVDTYRFYKKWKNALLNPAPALHVSDIFPPLRPPVPTRKKYIKDLVSICILTKNKLNLIKTCLESLQEHTDMDKIEILVGDTGTTEREVLDYYKTLPESIKIINFDYYNFSKCNNNLALQASGEFLLFLNNDTKVTKDWLENLLLPFRFDNVAVVGPKMLFANGTIQHAGSEIFTNEPYRYVGWHPYSGYAADYSDSNHIKSMPGVTGACLCIRHNIFNRLGAFDEYREECQDMDLCLQAREQRKRVIYNPLCCIYHYENGTRTVKESIVDRTKFRNKWAKYIDTCILILPAQSEKWSPSICVKLTGKAETDSEKIAQVKTLTNTFADTFVTFKSRDPLANEKYVKDFQNICSRVRIIPFDYEDFIIYDHTI